MGAVDAAFERDVKNVGRCLAVDSQLFPEEAMRIGSERPSCGPPSPSNSCRCFSPPLSSPQDAMSCTG